MRTIIIMATAAFASATLLSGVASADDHLHLTPPLYRDQARSTQQIRPGSELTTTPQLVPAAPTAEAGRSAAANRVMIEAAAR